MEVHGTGAPGIGVHHCVETACVRYVSRSEPQSQCPRSIHHDVIHVNEGGCAVEIKCKAYLPFYPIRRTADGAIVTVAGIVNSGRSGTLTKAPVRYQVGSGTVDWAQRKNETSQINQLLKHGTGLAQHPPGVRRAAFTFLDELSDTRVREGTDVVRRL